MRSLHIELRQASLLQKNALRIRLSLTFQKMKAIQIGNLEITFELNPPEEEIGFISEDFDFLKKTAYATPGIAELIGNCHSVNLIVSEIFRNLRNEARTQKLDYLQKLSIRDTKVWCIDDGYSICLMKIEER